MNMGIKEKIRSAEQRILADYKEKLRENPRLTYLFFELTDACNLSCVHCGSSSSPKNKRFLAYEDVAKVIKSVAERYDPRKIMICLSGGEPLLHPDFFRIAKYAVDSGFFCGVTTNGTLIDEEYARLMESSGIHTVTFSLDGLKKNHCDFRNCKWAYDKTLEGIENLHRASGGRIKTQITTVVHKGNIGELDELYNVVCESGVQSWRLVNMEPIGRAQQSPELLLDAEDHKYLLNYIREKRYSREVKIDVTYGCSHYLPMEYEKEVRDNYFICGAGVYVASILAGGEIYSCMDIERREELVQGNISCDDFIDVWEHRFKEFREDRSVCSSECSECPQRKNCGGDSMHTWDFENKKPKICLYKMLKGED